MRRILMPPTWVLSLTIAVVGVIALVGIMTGVWALNRTADQSARAAADRAEQEAIAESTRRATDSTCRIIDLYRIKPGGAQPETERGRELARAFEQEWRRLGCR